MLEIEVAEHGDLTIARLDGELVVDTISRLREAMTQLVAVNDVVIDLAEVTFIDSAGFGALVGNHRRLIEQRTNPTYICPEGTTVRKILNTTGFDRLANIDDWHDGMVLPT